MDPEIEELKTLVQKNLELTAETNHMIHTMRRNARMANFFRIAYWLAIIGVVGVSYYFYVAPYVTKLQSVFKQTQTTTAQAQSSLQNVEQYIQKMISSPQIPSPKVTQ